MIKSSKESGIKENRLEIYASFTLSANCFKRLYFTNWRMLDRTDISTGISDASPPSLTHGCAENMRKHHKEAHHKLKCQK